MDSPHSDQGNAKSRGIWRGPWVWLALLLIAVGLVAVILVVMPIFVKPRPGGVVADIPTAGFVLEIPKGDWICGSKLLKGGDPLPVGGNLVPKDPAKPAEIRVILRDGTDKTYETAQQLPAHVEERFPRRFWAALSGRYTKYAQAETLISRGDASEPPPVDAPARLDGGSLDLSSAFAAIPRGRFELQFFEIKPGHDETAMTGELPKPLFKTNFTWDREHPQAAVVGEYPPGLYLGQISADASDSLVGEDFWILATSPDRYDAVLKAYTDALSADVRTGAGDNPDSQATARLLRRATLATLATIPLE